MVYGNEFVLWFFILLLIIFKITVNSKTLKEDNYKTKGVKSERFLIGYQNIIMKFLNCNLLKLI